MSAHPRDLAQRRAAHHGGQRPRLPRFLILAGATGTAARELVKRIPIVPVDAKLTAAARAIQMAGITLCLLEGRPLTKCDCFIDLAIAETKERVCQILETRLANWAELARFGPARPFSVS